jgi:hypothetical protein
MIGSTIISCIEVVRLPPSSALTAREPSRDTASIRTAMEKPQHSLAKSEALPEFMSYSTDTTVDDEQDLRLDPPTGIVVPAPEVAPGAR